MLIFAITSSSKVASMSLKKDDKILGNITIEVRKSHAKSIIEQIDMLWKWCEVDISDITDVIVSIGPGSFTGVRIAISIIKGMFADRDVKIHTVNELEAVAYQGELQYPDKMIVSILDANKEKIYYFIMRNREIIYSHSVGKIRELIQELSKYSEDILFVGDASINYAEIINKGIENPLFLDNIYTTIDSRIFFEMYDKGLTKNTNIDALLPDYLEKSQAEREGK